MMAVIQENCLLLKLHHHFIYADLALSNSCEFGENAMENVFTQEKRSIAVQEKIEACELSDPELKVPRSGKLSRSKRAAHKFGKERRRSEQLKLCQATRRR